MSAIDIETAMHHLLAEPEDQDLVQAMLDAAEESAAQFIQRRIYADQVSLDADRLLVPELRANARAVYDQAIAAADEVSTGCDRQSAIKDAEFIYGVALVDADSRVYGVVLNPAIQAACLLILGHLFANREDVIVGSAVAEMPMGSRPLLMPYRIKMGV
ncbi:phage gp6-like head-tail connector protein [Pseudomonas sp. GD03842]|uniref:head-tail connector protein n=1 Tax=Pseudomonas sp. GD03842 TaxID=2975385 RepID=UPI00244A899C|nr:phage gp6-like head-tail connector protein [Pseudomonas sp. GD03842]MDH0745288.1 phage gp6-like head-tail connector protein [Pseudomonas sp. GD03842]